MYVATAVATINSNSTSTYFYGTCLVMLLDLVLQAASKAAVVVNHIVEILPL